mmetsp:Transcript_128501/g.363682  ORF Transcript_128501/g.363682 Transcript_128501/m.363682 type:complete len:527 (+) Transcript_128501:1210-2790(+)
MQLPGSHEVVLPDDLVPVVCHEVVHLVADPVAHGDRHAHAELVPLLPGHVPLVAVLVLRPEGVHGGEARLHGEHEEAEVHVEVRDRHQAVEGRLVVVAEEDLQAGRHGGAPPPRGRLPPLRQRHLPLGLDVRVPLDDEEGGLGRLDLADLLAVLAVAEVELGARRLLAHLDVRQLDPGRLPRGRRLILPLLLAVLHLAVPPRGRALPALLEVLVEQREGAVDAAPVHLEGRDARHFEGVVVDQELLEARVGGDPAVGVGTGLLPQPDHRVGELPDLVRDDPDLAQLLAVADVVGELRELVEREEEPLQLLEVLELLRERHQAVVAEVQVLQELGVRDAVGYGLELVVRQVEPLEEVGGRRDPEIGGHVRQPIVGKPNHLQLVEGGPAEDSGVDLADVVEVQDELPQLRALPHVLVEVRDLVVGEREDLQEVALADGGRDLVQVAFDDLYGVHPGYLDHCAHHGERQVRPVGVPNLGALLVFGGEPYRARRSFLPPEPTHRSLLVLLLLLLHRRSLARSAPIVVLVA